MKKQDWKYAWLLLKDAYWKDKKRVISMVLQAMMVVIRPYITIMLLGKLLDALNTAEPISLLFRYIFIAIGINLVCGIVELRTQEWFNQKLDYTKELESRDMNQKAMEMDYNYLEETYVSELRFQSFSKSYFGITGWCLMNVKLLIEGVFSCVILLYIVFPLILESKLNVGFIGSRWSALVLLVLIVLMTLFNYKIGIYYTQKAKAILDSLNNEYNKKYYYIDKLADVGFQKDVRMNNWKNMISEDTGCLFKKIQKIERKHGNMYILRNILSVSIAAVSGLFIYFFSGLRAYAGMITIGGVVTYASSIIQFSKTMTTFAATLGNMKSVSLFAKDYLEFMNLKSTQCNSLQETEIDTDSLQIDFEHVSFKYSGAEDYAIKDLNFSFQSGNRLAIVGKNGSGKTTFIKLLCGLYDVTEGIIKLNGVDIREYNRQEYWSLFSIVFQDFQLFAFSVGENIAASNQFDHYYMGDVLNRVGMGECLKRIPQGFAANISIAVDENGINFSGGEKQKLAIARAIYKNGKMVIMDEPTAALDPVSECDIYTKLDILVGNKTAVYISHRLSSCKFCQDILVFENGSIIQRGTHEELKKQEGLYHDMWEVQAKYYMSTID